MQKARNGQCQKNTDVGRWQTFRLTLGLLFLGGMMALPPGLIHASGLIPGTYPVSSAHKLDVKKNVTINGQTVAKGKTGADSVVQIDGTRTTVSQTLPALEPATFPDNSSHVKATEADSPFISATEVFFKKITLAKHQA